MKVVAIQDFFFQGIEYKKDDEFNVFPNAFETLSAAGWVKEKIEVPNDAPREAKPNPKPTSKS